MAELLKKLQDEMKAAMKSGDKEKLSTIRMLISEIKKVQIDQKKELSDDEIIAVIQRYAKQRKESIKQYREAGREDLAQKEEKELQIVQQFLPQPLTEEEIEKIVEETIKELNASSMKDMGKVMKAVMEKVKGRAEGAVVSSIVKSKLS
ncbi:MAG TPA: GatB/YqeY domain-containing protein [Persephonella sp.]|uniref:GatB/Yqey domain protein n=1 Tax=Persephonella marina (strain DSM 14350 / EX-H1) TaxID=123214 RepID=C0QTB9_PERMH|nr:MULTISPECIES: GatB/YqeY domain-containing protein [Persephonella]ACO04575.1 GatB/Yqey domain protein [Persephonella marina EX-H1]HCB70447.1 GatB/YqeY domain-containing protein [Persephonella sp.]